MRVPIVTGIDEINLGCSIKALTVRAVETPQKVSSKTRVEILLHKLELFFCGNLKVSDQKVRVIERANYIVCD